MPVIIILGKIRTGSLVSSAMLTESSKPTIAKNASEVAAVTAKNALLSLGRVEDHVREKSPLPPKMREEADEDDEQQAGQLDQGEHDVGLDALTDAAEVDQGDQRHERQRDDAGSAPCSCRRARTPWRGSRRRPATPSRPR